MGSQLHELAKIRSNLLKNMDEEKTVLDILGILIDFKVDRSLLKETGIGKTIAKLAKDPRDVVAKSAKPILNKWKDLAKEEKLSRSQSSQSLSDAVETPKAKSSSPVVEEKTEKIESNSKAKSEYADLPAMNLPSDAARKRIVQLLHEAFKEETKDAGVSRTHLVAIHIENAMCSSLGAGSVDYKAKYRSLKTNFNLNPLLKANLLSGALTASKLITMSNDELRSKEQAEELRKAKEYVFEAASQDWQEKNQSKIDELAGVKHRALFSCGKCGSNKIQTHQRQTRSADEPMTVFCKCECGNRWKIY